MGHWNNMSCLWTFSPVHYHYCVNLFLYSLKQSILSYCLALSFFSSHRHEARGLKQVSAQSCFFSHVLTMLVTSHGPVLTL